MLPTPEPTSPPEIPEPDLPEPVAVVPLPTQAEPPPAPPQPVPPPPPPPPLIEQPPPPPIFEEPLELEPLELEPLEPEPLEPEPTEPEFIEPDSTEPESSSEPVPQVFDAANTNPADASGYIAFSTTLQSLNDSIIPRNVRNATYDLNYLGDLCFTGESSLSGTLAVAIENSPTLATGKIITSTGYGEINQAIERWFAQLQAGQTGGTDELTSAVGVTLYDWLQQESGDWFVNDEAYEAYFFNVTVNLVNNPCAQNQA